MLIVGGVLLVWGNNFANSNVRDQLTAQQIYFPAAGSQALASPDIGPYLNQYAGQPLTTGAQAKAYADHFIAVHLSEVDGGKTYARSVPSLRPTRPTPRCCRARSTPCSRVETLRGMLLNAYAFWQLGQIALYAAIVAFAGAPLMLLLTVLGFVHLRRVPVGCPSPAATCRNTPKHANRGPLLA